MSIRLRLFVVNRSLSLAFPLFLSLLFPHHTSSLGSSLISLMARVNSGTSGGQSRSSALRSGGKMRAPGDACAICRKKHIKCIAGEDDKCCRTCTAQNQVATRPHGSKDQAALAARRSRTKKAAKARQGKVARAETDTAEASPHGGLPLDAPPIPERFGVMTSTATPSLVASSRSSPFVTELSSPAEYYIPLVDFPSTKHDSSLSWSTPVATSRPSTASYSSPTNAAKLPAYHPYSFNHAAPVSSCRDNGDDEPVYGRLRRVYAGRDEIEARDE